VCFNGGVDFESEILESLCPIIFLHEATRELTFINLCHDGDRCLPGLDIVDRTRKYGTHSR
jgi:hypothetical protein